MSSIAQSLPAAETPDVGQEPSFRAVAIMVWLAFVVVAGFVRWDRIETLHLADTDDHMRTVQVLDWLDGAAFDDVHQDRLNPPEGVAMHWSRLPDLPLAGLIAVFEPLVGRPTATRIAVAAVPPLVFLALLLALGPAAHRLMGDRYAPLMAIPVLFATGTLANLVPGRVDHHGLQVVLAVVALAALIKLADHGRARAPAAWAGLAGGLSLWIGAEGVPFIIAANLSLLLMWLARPRIIAGATMAYASTLLATTALAFAAATPPDRLAVPACDALSVVTVAVAGTVFGFWLILWWLRYRLHTVRQRVAAAIGIGLMGVGVLGLAYPECRGGPYAQVDPELAARWLANVSEAKSIADVHARGWYEVVKLYAMVAMGLAAAVAIVAHLTGEDRRRWLPPVVFLVVAAALSVWQIRAVAFAHLFAAVCLAWVAAQAFDRLPPTLPMVRRVLARAAILFAISPFLLVLPAKLITGGDTARTANASAATGTRSDDKLCSDPHQLQRLNAFDPALVIAPIDLGPAILLHTHHSVLGAPYHRNGRGNLDVLNFFSSDDPADARAIAGRRGARLVLICPKLTEVKLYRQASPDALHRTLTDGQPPAWLKPVPVEGLADLELYRIKTAD